jgi:hypothetical protein
MAQYQNGPLQQRAWIVMIMLAAARAGELRFQRYDEWYWDNYFENIDANWTEIKTVSQYCLLFGPAKSSYILDFYHAFGSFYAVENGLYRQADANPSIHKYTFPDLHAIKDAAVASKITRIIRSLMKPDTRDKFSSKSIRVGMATFFTMHPGVTTEQGDARCGWVSGASNGRHYKRILPVLTLPAGNAINGWDETKSRKFAPGLECLGSHVQFHVERLIDKLYVLNLPQFSANGHLRPFLRACTASLIRFHSSVARDLGQNHSIVKKLQNAAKDAQIRDGEVSDPIAVLHLWSQKIEKDFHARNPDLLCCENGIISKETSEQCLTLLKQLVSGQHTLHQSMGDVIRSNQNAEAALINVEERVSVASSPGLPQDKHHCSTSTDEKTQQEAKPEEVGNMNFFGRKEKRAGPDQESSQRDSKRINALWSQTLTWKREALDLPSSSGKKVSIQMILYYFKTRGGLKGKIDQLRTFQFPNKDAEPEKF